MFSAKSLKVTLLEENQKEKYPSNSEPMRNVTTDNYSRVSTTNMFNKSSSRTPKAQASKHKSRHVNRDAISTQERTFDTPDESTLTAFGILKSMHTICQSPAWEKLAVLSKSGKPDGVTWLEACLDTFFNEARNPINNQQVMDTLDAIKTYCNKHKDKYSPTRNPLTQKFYGYGASIDLQHIDKKHYGNLSSELILFRRQLDNSVIEQKTSIMNCCF